MQPRRRIPFSEFLGFEVLRFESGEAEIAVTLREELTNNGKMAHGGLTMSLLDVALGHAARAPAPGGEVLSVVTIEMKTAFMRPGTGRLLAKAKRLHRSATLAFCEGSVFDADGRLVAHATGTFKFVTGLPTGIGASSASTMPSD